MEMLTSNYEVMFVISKKNDSAQAKAIVEKLLDAIKPEDLAIKTLAMESFAYPIKKEKSGYFFVATFRSTSKNIGELNRLLKINSDVLRYLVINTDKNYGAKALKNQKKVKLAETRAKKYEEIRKQAELNEAKGIFTPPVVDRAQQNPKRPKIQKSQKRYLRNSYRKVGVYFKNEEGEVTYEPIVHAAKNNPKAKVGQTEEVAKPAVGETQVSQAPAKVANETLTNKPKVTQPVVETTPDVSKVAPSVAEVATSKLKTTEPVANAPKAKPVSEVAKQTTPPVSEPKIFAKPVAEKKVNDMVASAPITKPAVEKKVEDSPVLTAPTKPVEKVVEVPKVEPVVEKKVDVVASTPTTKPVVEEVVETPKVEPVVEVEVSQPVVEEVAKAPEVEPVVEKKVDDSVVSTTPASPVEKAAEVPEVEVSQPVVEEVVEAPKVEPVVEVEVSQPVVEEVAKAPEVEPVVEEKVNEVVDSLENVAPVSAEAKVPVDEPVKNEPQPVVVEYEEVIVKEETPVSLKANDVEQKIEIFEEEVISKFTPTKEAAPSAPVSHTKAAKHVAKEPLITHAGKTTPAYSPTKTRATATKHKSTKAKTDEAKTKRLHSTVTPTVSRTAVKKHQPAVPASKVVDEKPAPVVKSKRTTTPKKSSTVPASEKIRANNVIFPLRDFIISPATPSKRSTARSTTKSKTTATAVKKTKTASATTSTSKKTVAKRGSKTTK